jgi:hypothetical protein
MMNFARKMIFLSIGFAWIGANAQVDCKTSGKLVCLVPFISQAYLPNAAGSTQATAQAVNAALAFNGPIAAQLSQLPLAASAPGAIILTVNGNPQAFDNLGPILVDRPDSVGKGSLALGFSFQQFNFNHLDGIGLGAVPFVYFQTLSGQYTTQYLAFIEHVSIKYNQYVGLATYGLPAKTDVSVIVPFSRISIGASNSGNGVTPETYFLTSSNTIGASFPLASVYQAGSASGIGDVSLNVKHVLWSGGEAGRGALASGFALRLPTGDALNYLGSGAYGFNLYALASYKWMVSPHVKIGYQWNTNSVLLNPTGTGTNSNLPGGAQYDVGADYGFAPRLTVSGDLLANQFANATSLTTGSITIPYNSANTTSGDTVTLPNTTTQHSTYTTANLSAGLKWRPLRHQNLILYGNVLFQLNDVGLRSDPSPSGGITYSFHSFK